MYSENDEVVVSPKGKAVGNFNTQKYRRFAPRTEPSYSYNTGKTPGLKTYIV